MTIASNGARTGAGQHFVQFYESDDYLVDSVGAFVGDGLAQGEACILIVTDPHRKRIEQRLVARGADLDAALAENRYITLDAADTLAQFQVDGMPEPSRFAQVTGSLLTRAAREQRSVRMVGEMVALLWADGNAVAAIRLEELWNELQRTSVPFSLCCVYPMRGFASESSRAGFEEMCGLHARVIPSESYTQSSSLGERLRSISLLQQKAAALEAEIAERKVVEESLRVSENRYRRLFETSRDGILMLDPDSYAISDANPAVMDLLGSSREDLVGRSLGEIGAFAGSPQVADALRELTVNAVVRFDSLRLERNDGQIRNVELVGNRFLVNGHDAIQCNLHDITRRRDLEVRTQEALDALLALARTTVEAPDLGAEEPTGGQEEARRGVAFRLAMLACRVLGCRRVGVTAVEPVTERLRAVAVVGLTPEEEPRWWAEQHEREARGARLGDGADPEQEARFRTGEILVLDMTAPPYRDAPNPYGVVTSLVAPMRIGSQLIGILSLDYGGNTPHTFTVEEIALAGAVAHLSALALERERLLSERAAAEANALVLARTNQRMTEFLSIVSHELRTPLTVIMANLQLLARHYEQPAISADWTRENALLDRSARQAERLSRLIEDIVDLSRIREGKLELRPVRCDLVAIVREEVELQRQTHPDRVIQLDLAAADTVEVDADWDRVGQVVTNYLTNALKYSESDRPVSIRVDTRDGTARVSVRDEGPGIAPEALAQVWEIFHRVPGVQVRSGSGVGLGLGLHIARTIVERHSGTVGVDSVPGEGSTFWFTLPLADA